MIASKLSQVVSISDLEDASDGQQSVLEDSEHSCRWILAKFKTRIIIIIGSLMCVITSLIWMAAPRAAWDGLLNPLFALPYPVFSLAWEIVEMAVIFSRQDKAKGLQPIFHVVCELILWMAGLSIGMAWAITISCQRGSTVEKGLRLEQIMTWSDVAFFWDSLVLFISTCQFIIYVLSYIDVYKQRKKLEQQDSTIMDIIKQDRGGTEGSLSTTTVNTPLYWQHDRVTPASVRMPFINDALPVEMDLGERPEEMVASIPPEWEEMGVVPLWALLAKAKAGMGVSA